MKNKKSKWQERLEEAARKNLRNGSFGSSSHSAQTPDVTGIAEPQSHSARPLHLIDLKWKSLSKEYPRYYALVHLVLKDKTTKTHWSLVSNGEYCYFVDSNSHNHHIIMEEEVLLWAYAFEESTEKYEPMTEDDLKLFTVGDLKNLINQFKQSEIDTNLMNNYNDGLNTCIAFTEKLITSKLSPYKEL